MLSESSYRSYKENCALFRERARANASAKEIPFRQYIVKNLINAPREREPSRSISLSRSSIIASAILREDRVCHAFISRYRYLSRCLSHAQKFLRFCYVRSRARARAAYTPAKKKNVTTGAPDNSRDRLSSCSFCRGFLILRDAQGQNVFVEGHNFSWTNAPAGAFRFRVWTSERERAISRRA